MWMELRRGRGRRGSVPRVVLLCCITLCIFLICALTAGRGSMSLCLGNSRADSHSKGKWERSGEIVGASSASASATAAAQRRRKLGGPGSYPPRCAAKCGKCTPCRPVHVPVPPGTPVTTEYYPEAWRCKCRNRLYMP